MVLRSAVESGIIAANPGSGLRLAKPPSAKKQALTAAQVEQLGEAFDPFWRPLVSLLAYAGLRPGEAAALRGRHLDDLGNLLVEGGATEVRGRWYEGDTKTHKARVVPLTGSVLAELKAHMDTAVGDGPDSPIFCTPAGGRLRLSNFRAVFTQARDEAGLPAWATPYTLRHTAASLMAQAGVPVTAASALLGHDPAIYMRTYAHLYPDDLRGASAALEGARQAALNPPPNATGRRRTVPDTSETRGKRGERSRPVPSPGAKNPL